MFEEVSAVLPSVRMVFDGDASVVRGPGLGYGSFVRTVQLCTPIPGGGYYYSSIRSLC